MTNYKVGHNAEVIAADYLKSQGFQVIELNWKTPSCEIDIVAKKDGIIFFVEVKSRKSASFGLGLEYITPKKLKQMKYAAEYWLAANTSDSDCQLAGLSIDNGKISFILID